DSATPKAAPRWAEWQPGAPHVNGRSQRSPRRNSCINFSLYQRQDFGTDDRQAVVGGTRGHGPSFQAGRFAAGEEGFPAPVSALCRAINLPKRTLTRQALCLNRATRFRLKL